MSAFTVTSAENAAVRAATDVPGLVSNLQMIDSPLAAQLTGKALVASKTPWGTLLLPLVAYLAARYGLGWTPDVDALVAGVAVLVASYLMRLLTSVPITGLFRRAAVLPAPAPTASPVPFPDLGAKL